MATTDKFKGVLFGQVIGDALDLEAYSFSYYERKKIDIKPIKIREKL